MRLSPRAAGTSSVVGATICWGVGTVIAKHTLEAIPPFTLLAVQLFISSGFLWFVVRARGLSSSLSAVMRLSLLGLLNPGLAYALALAGLVFTTASLATILWAAEPILIFLLARPLLAERWNPPLAGSLLVGVVGVVAVAPSSSIEGTIAGTFLILAGVACCALYSVLSTTSARQAEPLLIAAAQQTSAFLLALILAIGEGLFRTDRMIVGPTDFLWAATAGLLYYAVAFVLYLIGLRHLPVARVGAMLNLVPVVGVAIGFLVLGERLTAVQALGGVLIIGSVFGAFSTQLSWSRTNR